MNKARNQQKQMARELKDKQGGVVTRYGTYYTESEWAEAQAQFEREAQEATDWLEKADLIKSHAVQMLKASDLFEADELPKLRGALDALAAGAKAQFTSSQKKEAVTEVVRWYSKQMSQL